MVEQSTQERAQKAFDRHVWPEAYEGFTTLSERGEAAGDDLERLGEAAWWSAHPAESIDAFVTGVRALRSRRRPASRCPRRAPAGPGSSPTARSRRAGTPGSSVRSASWTANRSLSNRGGLELTLFRAAVERGRFEEAAQHATTGQEIGPLASPTATSRRSHSCSKAPASSSSRRWSRACRWWMRARWRRSGATSRRTSPATSIASRSASAGASRTIGAPANGRKPRGRGASVNRSPGSRGSARFNARRSCVCTVRSTRPNKRR